jgi:hypothetical protein
MQAAAQTAGPGAGFVRCTEKDDYQSVILHSDLSGLEGQCIRNDALTANKPVLKRKKVLVAAKHIWRSRQ